MSAPRSGPRIYLCGGPTAGAVKMCDAHAWEFGPWVYERVPADQCPQPTDDVAHGDEAPS